MYKLLLSAALLGAIAAPALGQGYHDNRGREERRQGEENRQIGFWDCLDRVLVKVSGDQRLQKKPEMLALRDKAGDFVDAFRYHDRLEGIPIHDEQGRHDRQHFLTCRYKPASVN